MKTNMKCFLRGVGVGLIVTAAFFYLIYFANSQSETFFIKDEVIIERAKELGMDFIEEK